MAEAAVDDLLAVLSSSRRRQWVVPADASALPGGSSRKLTLFLVLAGL